MVQLNKNLGNFNFRNTALSAKANVKQTEKLDFKPAVNDADFPTPKDAYGRARLGDTVNGQEIVDIHYFKDNGREWMELQFD